MKDALMEVKEKYKALHLAQTTAFYVMTEEDFVQDPSRAKFTAKFAGQTLKDRNETLPRHWKDEYFEAIKTHGYPPHACKNQGYAPAPEPPKN